MLTQCGECGRVVDARAQSCPKCGAPRAKFKPTGFDEAEEPPHSDIAHASGPENKGGRTRVSNVLATVAIVIAVSGGVFIYSHSSKSAQLEHFRVRCVENVSSADKVERCECIRKNLDDRTYALAFVPLPRFFTDLFRQNWNRIVKESTIACTIPAR